MYNKKISFVIPCYYSERTIKGVVEGIIDAFPKSDYNIEIVLVNDGSTDGTYDVIMECAKEYDVVVGANLMRNFGQDSALMAGYNMATGDIIVSLDDDQQNPPEEAHKLIRKLENDGCDVVFGKYTHMKQSAFKNWGSNLNDKMAEKLVDKPKNIRLCSYFVMTSKIKDEIIKYDGPYPYVWGLILRTTRRMENEIIEHRSREIGTTTYTLKKLVGSWMNGFTAFSIVPLRIASIVGVGMSFIGLVAVILIVIQTLIQGVDVEGWASTICIVIILAGVQLTTIGLLGEYIGRMYLYANKSPLFVVRETTIDNNEKAE